MCSLMPQEKPPGRLSHFASALNGAYSRLLHIVLRALSHESRDALSVLHASRAALALPSAFGAVLGSPTVPGGSGRVELH